MKAVLLYIKYDRGAAVTVHDLGYPTTKTLKSWYREYISTGNLCCPKVRKTKLTAEQKRLAVDYWEHGRCISATIRALGYPGRETLRQWIHERCPDIRLASIQHRRHEPLSEDKKRQAVIELCARDGSAPAVDGGFIAFAGLVLAGLPLKHFWYEGLVVDRWTEVAFVFLARE